MFLAGMTVHLLSQAVLCQHDPRLCHTGTRTVCVAWFVPAFPPSLSFSSFIRNPQLITSDVVIMCGTSAVFLRVPPLPLNSFWASHLEECFHHKKPQNIVEKAPLFKLDRFRYNPNSYHFLAVRLQEISPTALDLNFLFHTMRTVLSFLCCWVG